MSLRVTQGMMQTNILRNINNNLLSVDKNQDMLSTGRRINKASDDPVGATYSLRYRSQLNLTEQYTRNITSAKTNLDTIDETLGAVNELLQRAQELTTQGVNGTNPQTSLDAIANELGQIYDQAVNLGNSQVNGKYIFNGQLTEVAPYTNANAASETTDSQQVQYQIYEGTQVGVSVTGNDVFGSPGDSDNMFSVLKGLQTAFASGDKDAASGLMKDITSRLDKVLDARSQIGAIANRVDLVSSRVDSLNTSFTSMLSKNEDADIAELATDLQTGQNVYQASLSVGAKLLQKSLVDYLG